MSARASTIHRDSIDYSLQLVFDNAGGVRLTRMQGKLAANERALQLSVKLPTAVFSRPNFVARIEVPAHEISIPPVDITALSSALRDQFGADILLTVQQQETPQ